MTVSDSNSPAARDGRPGHRERWIDIARGIGIILVVYGHAWRGMVSAHLLPDGGGGARLDDAIYAFHMPLFFLLAGLHMERGIGRGRDRFVLDRIKTLAYPYFLWSLIQGTLQVLLAGKTNQALGWHDVALIPIRPFGQFWFLYALFLCQIIIVLLPSRHRRTMVVLMAIVGIIVTTIWRNPNILLTAVHFLPFVVIGMFWPTQWKSLDGVLAGRPGLAPATAVAALAAFALIYAASAVQQPAFYLLTLLGIGATILLALALEPTRGATALAILGQASMAIYVMHTIVSGGLRIVMIHAGIDAPALILATATLGGLLVPLACFRFAVRRGWTLPLGFGKAPRSAA